MHARLALKLGLALTLWGVALPRGLAVAASFPQTTVERPNILILLVDDLGIGDPGCYNPASKIRTPHIDRIAREGMRFTDVHSSSSVCSPTRYAILTGRYAWRGRLKSGVLNGYSRALIEPGRPTIASVLKEHGYATAGIGKWHLGFQPFEPRRAEREQLVDYSQPLRPGPLTVGFDEFFGIPASLDMPPYVFVENDHLIEMPTAKVGPSGDAKYARGPFWRPGPAAPSFRHGDVLSRQTERAVAFLDRQAKRAERKPFFLYLALSGPHTPYLPSTKFRGKSGAGDYGDFVETVDASMGDVLSALDRNGLTESTFLVFASDNGARWTPEEVSQFDHRSNLNNRGQKSDIYDGGHRIPFLARWPGKIRAGSTSDELGCLVDLMATCVGVAAVPLPRNAAEDSFDLRPALLEKHRKPIRDAVVHHSGSGMFAIRSREWKLVEGLGSGGFTRPAHIQPQPGQPDVQLYDLQTDRAEQTNAAAAHPEIVRALRAKLQQIQSNGRSRPNSRAD
ncbi:MAG TPA: arylsulfatase [Planctomycetaceae bacterium]|jgi:arylsulfatase A-like enzyme|nr:arylsulfatase [Planctomycetaceae bacterium]